MQEFHSVRHSTYPNSATRCKKKKNRERAARTRARISGNQGDAHARGTLMKTHDAGRAYEKVELLRMIKEYHLG